MNPTGAFLGGVCMFSSMCRWASSGFFSQPERHARFWLDTPVHAPDEGSGQDLELVPRPAIWPPTGPRRVKNVSRFGMSYTSGVCLRRETNYIRILNVDMGHMGRKRCIDVCIDHQ